MKYTSPINSGFDFNNVLSQGGIQMPQPQTSTGPSPIQQIWGALNQPVVGTANASTGDSQNMVSGMGGSTNLSGALTAKNNNSANVGTPQAQGGYAASPQPSLGGATATNSQAAQMGASSTLKDNMSTGALNTGSGVYNSSNSSTGAQNTGFSVSVPNTVNSDVVNSGTSYADALKARNDLMAQFGAAAKKYYSGLYGGQLATFDAQHSGDTTDYGTGAAGLAQERSGLVNAQNLGAMQSVGQQLGYQTTFTQNQNPYQNQISPGSTAFDPSSNMPVNSGMGASPSTIMGSAQSLAALAVQNGSAQYRPDGSLDMQPYIDQARTFYGSGGMQGGQQAGMSPQGGTPSPYSSQGSQGGYGQGGYGNIGLIPSSLQYAVRSDSIGDQSIKYINASQVAPALLPTAYRTGGLAGIPALDQAGVGALNAAQQILGIVDAAKALSIRNLKPGTGGRIQDSLMNWANNYLQFNPDLSNFDQLRDAASKATTALAGGVGSGFRMNSGIIQAAVDNLPRAGDNLETALTRADALGTQIINGLKPVFPNVSSGKYGDLLHSQYGSASNLSGTVTGGGQSGSGIVDWASLQ